MQASRLRNSISYGLIALCAVVLAMQIPTFASSLSLGGLFRLVLLPITGTMALLAVVQTRERGWGIPRFHLAGGWALALILPASVFVASLTYQYGARLNLVTVPVLALLLVGYGLALHSLLTDKEHHALAIFLLSVPLLDFVEWDSGLRWTLFELRIGGILLLVKGSYIYVLSLFGVWAARRLTGRNIRLTQPRIYVPVMLLLLWALTSTFLFTYNHNKEWALNQIFAVLVFPLLMFIMMVETVDTKPKLCLMVYATIALAIISISIAFYMSLRQEPIASPMELITTQSMSVDYVLGSISLKGMMLSLIAPLVLALFGIAENKRHILITLGLVVYTVGAQLASFSRTGLLASFAGAAGLLTNKKVRLLALFGLILVLIFWGPVYTYGLARFHDIGSFEDLNLKHLSYGRYQGWNAAIGMIREQPILGVGLKNFRDYAPRFSQPIALGFSEGSVVTGYMPDAHNLFLSIAAELGLVGLGFLLLFLGMLLLGLIRGLWATRGNNLIILGLGLLGAYVAHLVMCLTGNGFWVAKSSLVFNFASWTLFALMVKFRYVGDQRSPEAPTGERYE